MATRVSQLLSKLERLQSTIEGTMSLGLPGESITARERFAVLKQLWDTHDCMERFIIAEERHFTDDEVDFMTEPGRTWKEMKHEFKDRF